MSFIKSNLADECGRCRGAGEIITPISIPTTNPNYPGYAYDEAVEPCPACAGTGIEPDAPARFDRIAAEHQAINQTREQQLAQAIKHEKEGSAWIL